MPLIVANSPVSNSNLELRLGLIVSPACNDTKAAMFYMVVVTIFTRALACV